MASLKNILVIRFSALGDIAMTVPVIKNVLAQNPDLSITMLSVPFAAPLFAELDRVTFIPTDLKKYAGVFGMIRLARHLKSSVSFDAVADLHDVLRTKILRRFLGTHKIAVVDKGRKEKHELTRPRNKVMRQLKSNFQRYADVFNKFGISVSLNIGQGLLQSRGSGKPSGNIQIGVAPFAKHLPKVYPLSKMREVVELLSKHDDVTIILIGSAAERPQLNALVAAENVMVLAKSDFTSELAAIAGLDVMISMDSANMHLASLFGVPVVSVWGGTHPFLGFSGWGQSTETFVQDDIGCRPSSVFGNKPCPVHGRSGCMNGIQPQQIVNKTFEIIQVVQKKN